MEFEIENSDLAVLPAISMSVYFLFLSHLFILYEKIYVK